MNGVRLPVLLSLLAVACGGSSSPPAPTPPSDSTPVASAGADQAVASGAAVTLDGSGSSDPAGRVMTYHWAQTAGTAVALSSDAAVSPSFIAPAVPTGQPQVALSFALTVTTAGGISAPSSVTVTVSPAAPANPPPVASAGRDQAVGSGAAVALDGSLSSDPDGQAISFTWAQISGPAVTLSGATTARPTFTAPLVASGAPAATLLFSLVVSDATASSAPASVVVTVNPAGSTNPPPPGTPPPAVADPSPPPAGGSGSNRFEMGAGLGLYLVDPALGEPSVQGLVNVTYGPTSGGNFIPPDGTTVTMNGVALLRDPNLNGSYWRLDPAGPQPTIGSGGEIVLVATATVAGKTDVRTLVLPCPHDVAVASTPPIGAALTPAAPPATPLRLTSAADITLNVNNFVTVSGITPQATLYGYEPATRGLVASGSPTHIAPGALDVSLPVLATTAPAYLLDLRWPGPWIIDGQTGGFCGLVKRWTYTK